VVLVEEQRDNPDCQRGVEQDLNLQLELVEQDQGELVLREVVQMAEEDLGLLKIYREVLQVFLDYTTVEIVQLTPAMLEAVVAVEVILVVAAVVETLADLLVVVGLDTIIQHTRQLEHFILDLIQQQEILLTHKEEHQEIPLLVEKLSLML
jgi:hypothetical protein